MDGMYWQMDDELAGAAKKNPPKKKTPKEELVKRAPPKEKPTLSPQQLNFALWCATTGCGVSREILSRQALAGNSQLRAFYLFHVYLTTKRILFEMGGFQRISSLPDGPNFSETDNKYDKASYRRICAEFGVDPTGDFRFKHGQNHSLAYIFENYPDGDFAQKQWQYPLPLSNPSNQRSADEGGTDKKGNKLDYIRNDQGADRQFEFFVPDTANRLTSAGLAWLNQSIEAFVYCILVAQVNVGSSILGNGGRAKESQREFLVLLEDATRTPDISKSVQRYQLAVDEAKVRLDLAVAPGAWLMPSRMVLNTGSVVGYNNQLRQAGPEITLGVNNDVNQGTKKKSALHLMGGGPSKVNAPNSHPSNPIRRAAASGAGGSAPTPASGDSTPSETPKEPTTTAGSRNETHDTNKVLVAVGAVAIAGAGFLWMC